MGQLSHPHPEVLAAAAAAPCRQPRQLWALGRSHSLDDPRGLSDVVTATVPLPGPGSLWGLCSGLGESHPLSAAAVAAAAVDWSPAAAAAAANGRREVLRSRPQGAGERVLNHFAYTLKQVLESSSIGLGRWPGVDPPQP